MKALKDVVRRQIFGEMKQIRKENEDQWRDVTAHTMLAVGDLLDSYGIEMKETA